MRGRGGVKVEDLRVGTGAPAERGMIVSIRYSGYLNRGKCFDRDVESTFSLGPRRVIAGLQYGIEKMRVGGIRRIHVPPHLAYGEQAVGEIPANAKLIFEVELLSVKPPAAA